MIGIQSSLSVNSCKKPSFGSDKSEVSKPQFKMNIADFERGEGLDGETRSTLDQLGSYQQQFDSYADKLSKEDATKSQKKAGKLLKGVSSVLGIAAFFVLTKAGLKTGIETGKSFLKSESVQKFLGHFDGAKKVVADAGKAVGDGVKSLWGTETVQKGVKFVSESKPVKKITEFLASEKGATLTEPLKNAWNVIKNPKAYASKIQSVVENAGAATATGAHVINKVAGNSEPQVVEVV